MKAASAIFKAFVPVILIVICSSKVWSISSAQSYEKTAKNELKQYRLQQSLPARQEKHLPVDIIVPEAGTVYIPDAMHIPDTGYAADEENGQFIPQQEGSPEPEPEIAYMEAAIFPDETEPVINTFIVDLQENINAAISSWLLIPGTGIDYPVVCAEDNEFYLKRNISGKESKSGSLFTDFRCQPDYSGRSTIIYGHNMKNRSMFGSLRLYADPGYFDEHRSGTLFTGTATYTLDIFAYMVTSYDDGQIYAGGQCIDDLLDYVKDNARIYRDDAGDIEKVLILSTCAYEFEGARIVVLASIT